MLSSPSGKVGGPVMEIEMLASMSFLLLHEETLLSVINSVELFQISWAHVVVAWKEEKYTAQYWLYCLLTSPCSLDQPCKWIKVEAEMSFFFIQSTAITGQIGQCKLKNLLKCTLD